MEEVSDERLMERVLEQDRQAFSILVRRHAQRFYRTAWRMTGNSAEAEELVQEAFLKIWDRPQIWKPERQARFTTWFTRIVINQAIDRNRKNKFSDFDFLSLADGRPGKENQMVMDEQQAFLEAAIQRLPARQKAALNLCYYEEMKNAEAARLLGIGVKALESLLVRARENLRQQLRKGGLYG